MPRVHPPLEERLFSRIDAGGDCWLWKLSRTRDGYGVIGLGGGRKNGIDYVHRVVWRLLVGPIAKGIVLRPRCRVRHCCNPDHMQLATQAQLLKVNQKRANR
jgi:hypothetical protein